jgi:hypothetical protein
VLPTLAYESADKLREALSATGALIEMLDPSVITSSKDMQLLPLDFDNTSCGLDLVRRMPKSDRELPKRVYARIETVEPVLEKLKMLRLPPILPKDLTDIAEPSSSVSTTEVW